MQFVVAVHDLFKGLYVGMYSCGEVAGGSSGRDNGGNYPQFTLDFEDRVFVFVTDLERLDLEVSCAASRPSKR